jgi:hypothetical protein
VSEYYGMVVTVELLYPRILDEGRLPARDALRTTVVWWLSGRILRV